MEIIERLQQLKNFIDENSISVYEKKPNRFIKKIFDLWDNNNTVGVIIFANNSVKIEGESCLLKKRVEKIIGQNKKSEVI